MQTIKFKRLHPEAKLPEYKTENAVGADVYSVEDVTIEAGKVAIIKTGWATEFDPNLEIQIRGRSGLASKGIFTHLGSLDSDFRGEIGVILYNTTSESFDVKKGDRIGQFVVAESPVVDFKVVKELSETDRGTGGFGSTGK